MKKRKRAKLDNLIDTISSDEDELDKHIQHKKIHTDFVENYPLNDICIHKKASILEEIQKRKITMNQVYELELSMDEYIWFWTYINMRCQLDQKNQDMYTEEYYDITEKIYKKYILLKTQEKDFQEFRKVNDVSIIDKIITSNQSVDVKVLLYKKYKLYCEDTYSEDYAKCIEWIDIILSIPLSISQPEVMLTDTDICNKLRKLNYCLSNKIYGLECIKEQIIKTMCSQLLNSSNTGNKIMTLVGPPGVGKTTIGSIIAGAMEIPFDQISFGSIQDAKILTGHSSTYIGAIPGLFTKILIKSIEDYKAKQAEVK